MRKTIFILATALATFSSCQRLNLGGKPVRFSASAKSDATKTVYSGDSTGNHEDIYWEDGDQILIQSSDAAVASTPGGETSVVYNRAVNEDRTTATITNTVTNGLTWNETDDVTFYGVYPAGTGIRGTGQFNMSIDKDQVYADLIDPSTTTDMSSAYMLARTDVSGGASTVPLEFYPAFTAFEIHLANRTPEGSTGTGDITLNSLSVKSTSDDLSGAYYSSSWSGGKAAFTADGTGYKEVTVAFPANTTISDTKEVAFTLFVLPVKNVTNLYLEVTFETSNGTKTKKLNLKQNGNFITFDACKKHRLIGVTLDSGETWDLYMTLDIIPQQLDREDNSLVDSEVENKLSELTVTNYEDANFTTGEIVLNHNRGIFYFFTEVGRWTRWQASLIGTPGVFAFCKEDGTLYLDVNGNPRTTFSGSIDGNTQYFYIKALENSPTGHAILRITAYDNRGNSKVVYDMVNFNDFSEYTLIKNTR